MAWVRAVFDAIAAPFVGYHTKIKPEWIDLNGHFSAGNYFMVFDDAVTIWTSAWSESLAPDPRLPWRSLRESPQPLWG